MRGQILPYLVQSKTNLDENHSIAWDEKRLFLSWTFLFILLILDFVTPIVTLPQILMRMQTSPNLGCVEGSLSVTDSSALIIALHGRAFWKTQMREPLHVWLWNSGVQNLIKVWDGAYIRIALYNMMHMHHSSDAAHPGSRIIQDLSTSKESIVKSTFEHRPRE